MKTWLGLLVVAAALCLIAPAIAQDGGEGDKLDPETPASGPPPFDVTRLESYSTEALMAVMDVFEKTGSDEAKNKAKRIAEFLAQRDPSFAEPATTEPPKASPSPSQPERPRTSLFGRGRRTPPKPKVDPPAEASTGDRTEPGSPTRSADAPPTQTAAARPRPAPSRQAAAVEPAPAPSPSASSAATAATQAASTSPDAQPERPRDWFEDSQRQLQDFWLSQPETTATDGSVRKNWIYDPVTKKLVNLDDHTRQVGTTQAFTDELANRQSGMGIARPLKDN
ncbi:MAG: hypothetical protein HY815_03255 [Candidatus Riflebacteria bacterium]|nr:hypothetical protein [Candidatus Riflebacteria bacterium]